MMATLGLVGNQAFGQNYHYETEGHEFYSSEVVA